MTRGSLALILHAHLPFVRHPEHEWFFEEEWLFEAITETYVPLVAMMRRLHADAVPFRITMSVTPTLGAMLRDELLLERYVRHLNELIELSEREIVRTRATNVAPLAHFYHDLFRETKKLFVDEWQCDLIQQLRELRDLGSLEIIASSATHAVLPLFQKTSGAAHAQIAIGCDEFREIFGADPVGFWLPECAYAPGIDVLLQRQEVRWFVIDAHGLTSAQPAAMRGTYAPCFTPAGPAAFARDRETSRQVWDAKSGFPGDPAYRDFYRDLGFDLTPEIIGKLSHGIRKFTGIKYHRVTGGDGAKQLYDPEGAKRVAHEHARHFLERRTAQFSELQEHNFTPIVVAPFDAELFGHWWFEGPIFLEQLIRLTAARTDVGLTTPTQYLEANRTQQSTQVAASSWGDKGYFDVWLDEKCSWIYPLLHRAGREMSEVTRKHSADSDSNTSRVLKQLARELLLAQSSDWPFLIRNHTAGDYASARVRDHLERFRRLHDSFVAGRVDDAFLSGCEARDNLFRDLDWRHYISSCN